MDGCLVEWSAANAIDGRCPRRIGAIAMPKEGGAAVNGNGKDGRARVPHGRGRAGEDGGGRFARVYVRDDGTRGRAGADDRSRKAARA